MATRTKKSGQRKAFAVGIAAFASVCLIATGFAAWVISAQAKKNENGNIAIGTVNSANIKIKVDQDTDDDGQLDGVGFSFNPKESDKSGRVRNDGTNFENLGFTLTGTVGPQRFVTSFKVRLDIVKEKIVSGADEGAKKEWEVDTKANARFVAAQDANYITLPDCFGQDVDLRTAGGGYTASSDTDDNAVATFSKAINFGWGTVFGGENPGEYYDTNEQGKAVSDDDVEKTLSKFYTALTGVEDTEQAKTDQSLNFRITLTAGTDQKA